MLGLRSVLATALLLTVAGPSCSKRKTGPDGPIAPTAADGGAQGEDGAALSATPQQPVRKTQVRFAISGIGDMLDAVSTISERIDPRNPWDARANLQAGLLTGGFGPGFLESLDLAGMHAVAMGIEPGDNRGDHLDLGATVAVLDPRRLIDSMPSSSRPTSEGAGRWRLVVPPDKADDRERTMWLRESQGAIELGLDEDDLATAAGLRTELGMGRRIRVRLWDLPKKTLSDAASQLPAGPRAQVDAIMRDAKRIEAELDFGTDRDFQALTTAEAPFRLLGIDAFGPPRATATALEQDLPPNPLAAITVSLGSAKPVHRKLDQLVPIDEIPEPFGTHARAALGHVHTLLDQGSEDAAVALYLSKRGQGRLVVAAQVRDETSTRAALRGLAEQVREALEAQRRVVGPDASLDVKWQPDRVRAGNIKGDLLTITIPKALQSDANALAPFLSGSRLEQVILVKNNVALFALGAGARSLVATAGRKGAKHLGRDPGLERVRRTVACQVCITADASGLMRLWLLTLKAQSDDKAKDRALAKGLASLTKVRVDGRGGAGILVEDERAALGIVVPQSLMFASAADVKRLLETIELIDRGGRPEPKPDDD